MAGGRNGQPDRLVFALGQLVGTGALDRIETEQRLFDAGLEYGYVAKAYIEAAELFRLQAERLIQRHRLTRATAGTMAELAYQTRGAPHG
jgi:hypothetical protein